jgi:type VI secretion system protein VasJ
MTKGYDLVERKAGSGSQPHSWRFWLRGAKKEQLLCGLARDSSDTIGRPYPFFILGEGAIHGWEREWDRLPFMLNSTWQRIEAVAAGRYDDVQALFSQLGRLPAPGEEEHDRKESLGESPRFNEAIPGTFRDLLIRTGRAVVDLGDFTADSPASAVNRHLVFIKEDFNEPPPAVFMGGTPRRTYLAVIAAPLRVEDFLMLWST